jgi:hypothetical protein
MLLSMYTYNVKKLYRVERKIEFEGENKQQTKMHHNIAAHQIDLQKEAKINTFA